MSRLFSAAALALLVLAPIQADDLKVADPALSACIAAIATEKNWHDPKQVQSIKCHNQGIESLAGLRKFNNLQALSLFRNRLQQLELKGFAKLRVVNVARNQLKQMQLSDLPALEKLYFFDNNLQAVQLFDLPALTLFKGNGNGMLRFDYRALPALSKVYLFDNRLETIDIYHLPALQYMDVRENPMPDELYDEMDAINSATILHDGNADDW